jgi:hypothetical protein
LIKVKNSSGSVSFYFFRFDEFRSFGNVYTIGGAGIDAFNLPSVTSTHGNDVAFMLVCQFQENYKGF